MTSERREDSATRTGPWRRRAAPLALLALLAAQAAGCAIFRAKDDTEHVRSSMAGIEGTVSCPTADGEPIVTVLWDADDPAKGVVRSWIAYGDEAYRFVVAAPARYGLLSFRDLSSDLSWQPGEPAAIYGEGAVVELKAGERRTGVDVVVGTAAPKALPVEVPRAGETTVWSDSTVTYHLGELTDLNDGRFSDENASLGLWEPSRFLKDPGIGIYFLEPYDPKKLPVLFFHGAGGSPRNFQALIGALDPLRFQPWLVHYASGNRLPLICQRLAQLVLRLQAEKQVPAVGVVAHSMGGLVARGVLNELRRAEAPLEVPFLVTLSTPWGGHAAANLGVAYSPGVVPQWVDMTPGSDFLKKLWRTPLPPEAGHYLLFGYKGQSSLFLDRANDGSVTLPSMLDLNAQAGARRVVAFDHDHMSILTAPEVLATITGLINQQKPAAGEAR
ncbi:MAG: hypothetical protein HGA98_03455 [Deltaproteobacteria bacterium]|nr:hypothetical protein [Deltaproteobacteria bacterium]